MSSLVIWNWNAIILISRVHLYVPSLHHADQQRSFTFTVSYNENKRHWHRSTVTSETVFAANHVPDNGKLQTSARAKLTETHSVFIYEQLRSTSFRSYSLNNNANEAVNIMPYVTTTVTLQHVHALVSHYITSQQQFTHGPHTHTI